MVRFRHNVVALLVVVLGVFGALVETPASAMTRGQAPCGWPKTINPLGSTKAYCVNPTWKPYVDPAYHWALTHRHLAVPFPSWHAKSYQKYKNTTYVVYVVLYRGRLESGEPHHIYKYGLTRVDPWQHRANKGKNQCRRNVLYVCKIDWVTGNHG